MKIKLFVVALLLTILATTEALSQSSRNRYLVTPAVGLIGDTLETSTTLTYDFNTLLTGGQDFARNWRYSITVVADSVSGANAGTITLQVSDAPEGATNMDWRSATDAETIDGTGQSIFGFSGALDARRCRLVVTSPSGTRKTAIRVRAVFKDSQPR